MGYDLRAINPKDPAQTDHHMGAFSFPVILEFTSYLYPAIFGQGQYYMPAGSDEADPRFVNIGYPDGGGQPACLNNDGFAVTEEEAKIMARFARNWVRVQRSLPEENRTKSLFEGEKGRTGIKREDALETIMAAIQGRNPDQPWPVKIRDDFVDKIEKFADWAEQSGGFEIH